MEEVSRKEYKKKWREKNKEKIAEYNKAYREAHKEKIKEYMHVYLKPYLEKWRKTHLEYMGEWRKENRDKLRRYTQKYSSDTKIGRANNLVTSYNQSDKLHDRGKGDLTAKWVVENIFTKPCAHCGETDWHKLGCNRLDNSKPHTMDNVEPCCAKCNRSLKR